MVLLLLRKKKPLVGKADLVGKVDIAN